MSHYNTPKNITAYRKFVIIVGRTGREFVVLPRRFAEFCRRHNINCNTALSNSNQTPDRNIPLRLKTETNETFSWVRGKDSGLVLLAKNHPKSRLK